MKTMEGKVVLITGGGSGIGRATALAFAREGAELVIAGRRANEGEQTVQLAKQVGAQAIFVQTDVSQESEVEALVNKAVITYGRLDAAFNNAGIEGELVPIVQQKTDNFDAVMSTNVKGVYLSMKHEILHMANNGGGAIVNNASVLGLVGTPGGSIYAASKHAVLGLTKSAALEVAKLGVRVNAVSPAMIETDMHERISGGDQEAKASFAAMHPVGRVGKPEEVANAVLWLCSAASSFVTGQSLTLDGGFSAQ